MDISRFIYQLQTCSIEEFKEILKGYDVKLSSSELKKVHPLLQEISLTWLVLGVPMPIQQKLINILGENRSIELFNQLKQKVPSTFREK
ncbi:hypothetical protein [Psychrobacillus sp.]|uniref:hypothetical protein n=1 Tax=Psychrobacillus sp. TaxID=1871623 RepID=UPI0028BDA643|nr:hypothetical protein [Psychrobacillus sp.]